MVPPGGRFRLFSIERIRVHVEESPFGGRLGHLLRKSAYAAIPACVRLRSARIIRGHRRSQTRCAERELVGERARPLNLT